MMQEAVSCGAIRGLLPHERRLWAHGLALPEVSVAGWQTRFAGMSDYCNCRLNASCGLFALVSEGSSGGSEVKN